MHFGYANIVSSILLLATTVQSVTPIQSGGPAQTKISPPPETWWANSSCYETYGEVRFKKMIDEAIDNAKLIRDRLIRTKDQEEDAHNAFKTLFKFEITSKETEHEIPLTKFKSIVGGFKKARKQPYAIGNLVYYKDVEADTVIKDPRSSSLVRIYCGNARRFELVPDENIDGVVKNSERSKEKQEWFDPINKILVNSTDPNCDVELEGKSAMLTQRWHGASDYDATERKRRSTISICDTYLNLPSRYDTFDDLPKEIWEGKKVIWEDDDKTTKSKKPIDRLTLIGSQIMLHEFTHISPHNTNDGAYGWKRCIKTPVDEVFRIADAYNLLAVIFRSMEKKFALHRKTSTDGSLYKNKDIEDRVKYDEKSKRDTGATDLLNKNTSMGQEIRTRSNLDVDWSQAGRSVDLTCEDTLDGSAIGMRCKPFRA